MTANSREPGKPLRAAINLGNPVLAYRDPVSGELAGVSVALAKAIATNLGRDLECTPYSAAGKVVEAGRSGAWDIAFLAIDPQRATVIAFSEPYVVIEGVFLVGTNRTWQSLEDVDKPGIRISVGRGAAYDLYLSRALKYAELVRVDTSADALNHFVEHGLEASAGVRQPVEAFAAKNSGLRVIPEPFTAIRQAVALPIAEADLLARIQPIIAQCHASGLIAKELAAATFD